MLVSYTATHDDLATATNLYEKHQYVGQNGKFVAVYAPLFACFLTFCKLLFGDIIFGFEVVSLLILWASNFMIFKIFEKVPHFSVRLGLVLVSIFFVQHIHVHIFMLSESLFLLFFYSYIYLKFQDEHTSHFKLVLLNILILLMFFTRYASLILILGFGIVDLFKKGMSVSFLLKNYPIPFILVCIWLVICYTHVGNITGDEFSNYKGSDWEILYRIFGYVNRLVFPLVLIPLLMITVYYHPKNAYAIFLVHYLCFIFYFTKTNRLELDGRILVPCYIFMMLMIKDIYSAFTNKSLLLMLNVFMIISFVFTFYRFVKIIFFD